MKRCVIFAAQPVSPTLAHWWEGADFVIAADAGYRSAMALGVEPDLLLGDYDSAPAPHLGGKMVRLPAEKDDTDTFFAARKALEAHCTHVTILGGTGGRLDHTLANLHTLVFLHRHGVHAVLADEANEVTVLGKGRHTVKARVGWYLSLFPAGACARGVTLRGLKYPLENAQLHNHWPVGVSNEFTAGEAQIALREGEVYCMLCKM